MKEFVLICEIKSYPRRIIRSGLSVIYVYFVGSVNNWETNQLECVIDGLLL